MERRFGVQSGPGEHRGGAPLTVTLARSGAAVAVDAAESVLAAVRRTVPGVAYSCQQGFCGSCRTRVLAGTVGGRRVDSMLLCSARGDGLVLDL
jgi:ferredoxin